MMAPTAATTPATIHLVIGPTGAGKSTYARALARDIGAIRYAVDEWMQALFLPDRPEDASASWYLARIARATSVIWQATQTLTRLAVPVVLEIGLTEQRPRKAFCLQVHEAGIPLQLHVLEAPRDVRWARVDARNRDQGQTFTMVVTRPMFDYVEDMWEPPTPSELEQWNAIVVDSG